MNVIKITFNTYDLRKLYERNSLSDIMMGIAIIANRIFK